jgi:EAL domain-containing protein (putative c-di-GMP-specific phosphodiesterase class I)
LDLVLQPEALSVLFQPIIEYSKGRWRLHALECLVRGPKGTNLEPANVLFEYSRKKRAESLVDRACIAAILREASALPPLWDLCLNVHASTLGRDAEFSTYLAQTAETNLIPLSRITIEIVEHTPYWNQPVFFNALADLRKAGVKIALDDFGYGQSNYRMVLDCWPDKIKVDRYIVKGCHADDCRQAIIESVARLARRIRAQVIAEGVEDTADLQTVIALGVTLIQGYLFFPPLSLNELLHSKINMADCGIYLSALNVRDLVGVTEV